MTVISYQYLGVTDADFNYNGEKTYNAAYRVFCNDITDGPEVVTTYLQSTEGIAIGSTYAVAGNITEVNPYAYCLGISPKRVAYHGDFGLSGKPAVTWEVTYSFGPFPVQEREPNPLLQRYIISFDAQTFDEPATEDQTGKKLLNAAGDPFSEPLTRPAAYSILRVSRNEATFDLALTTPYLHSVNVADWTVVDPITGASMVFDARCALCTAIKPSHMYSQVLEKVDVGHIGDYWQVEYEFHIKDESWDGGNADDVGQGWDRRILNAGYNELVSSARQRIVDNQDNPVPNPVPLDHSGAKIDPVTGTPTYRTFRIYDEKDFDAFNFTG